MAESKPTGQKEVFVSHYEEPLAIEVREALHYLFGKKQVKAFIAGRNIPHGSNFRQSIHDAVGRSIALVCLITKDSKGRPWINYELGLARALKKPVFMVIIEGKASDFGQHPVGDTQLTHCKVGPISQFLVRLQRVADIPALQKGSTIDQCATDLVRNLGHVLRDERELRKNHLSVIQSLFNDRVQAANLELRNAPAYLESEYLELFKSSLAALPKESELLTVCGDKSWEYVPVWEYLKQNTDVCEEKGVAVHRVYVEPDAGFGPAENALIERHCQWMRDPEVDFKVSVVLGKRAHELRQKFKLPDGFGLVMPKGTAPIAMMHYGLGVHHRRARAFRERWIVDVYRWLHGQLAANTASEATLNDYLSRADKDYSMVDQFIPLPPSTRGVRARRPRLAELKGNPDE